MVFYAYLLSQMSDIRKVKKYWPLKMISTQFRKSFTAPTFCHGWTKNLQTFSRHFFSEWPSKCCTVDFTAIFVCLLSS